LDCAVLVSSTQVSAKSKTFQQGEANQVRGDVNLQQNLPDIPPKEKKLEKKIAG
jgi:hypothetical protein